MDAGLAGLIGAAIGGVLGAGGAVAAAAVTGRGQLRANLGQMQRTARRAVYLPALAEYTDIMKKVDQIWADFVSYYDEDTTPPVAHETSEDLINRISELFHEGPTDTYTAMRLEGPPGVYEQYLQCDAAVGDLLSTLRDSIVTLGRYSDGTFRLINFRPSNMDESVEEIGVRRLNFGMQLDRFTVMAHDAMYRS
ncbi:hypothetical protein [Streptomyces sp. GbtcB6]|uniref:hypothetical protein n=1 Tax=Streptomyces sp. GbtcB6 TaxID=2824751 RepID=UPI001C307C98|nr:hypothetical protein [Streptomyces sp. GbtcB6]